MTSFTCLITLSLILAIWTVTWSRQGWQAWLVRIIAILISILAFPAIEDISGPVREQYVLRIFDWIGDVSLC